MEENEFRPVVSREELVKRGISAVACFAGSALLLAMVVGARFRLFGIILSALALVFGIGAFLSRDHEDKKPALVLTAAGVLGLILRFIKIPALQAFAGTFLGVGAVGLFAAGILKGIKFLRGLKSRQ